MSQAKIDARKEAKKHLKENIRKEKLKANLITAAVILVFAAIVGWAAYSLGTSIYQSYRANQPAQEIDLTPLTDYMTEVSE